MNIERLEQVAAAIEANMTDYDQSRWLHPCGTPACIAGWAAHLSLQEGETLREQGAICHAFVERGAFKGFDTVENRAREWLDLTAAEAHAMFDDMCVPIECDGEIEHRTPCVDEALNMLDHAIATQTVTWEALD